MNTLGPRGSPINPAQGIKGAYKGIIPQVHHTVHTMLTEWHRTTRPRDIGTSIWTSDLLKQYPYPKMVPKWVNIDPLLDTILGVTSTHNSVEHVVAHNPLVRPLRDTGMGYRCLQDVMTSQKGLKTPILGSQNGIFHLPIWSRYLGSKNQPYPLSNLDPYFGISG